jgi:hypothetical protein
VAVYCICASNMTPIGILRVLLLLSCTVQHEKTQSPPSICKYIEIEAPFGQQRLDQVSKHVIELHEVTFCTDAGVSTYSQIYIWIKHARQRTLRYTSLQVNRKAVSLMLLVISGLETNPGPRKPKFPCGICTKACKTNCLACDECDLWIHKSCVGMSTSELARIGDSEEFWKCPACSALNSSSELYAPAIVPTKDESDRAELSNLPNHDASIPDSISDISIISRSSISDTSSDKSFGNTTTHPISSSPKPVKSIPKSRENLRILNINFQSLKLKGRFLESLIETAEPDIIIGSETWLTDDISSEELISNSMNYDVYRRDRLTDAHGGVLIAARKELMLSDVVKSKSLELISGKIKLKNKKQVIIAAYYRPPKRTEESYLSTTQEEFANIRLTNKNAIIIIAGDFNLPDIDWPTGEIVGSQYPKRVNLTFFNIISDNNLEQQVDFPTRKDNILDIVLTGHPAFKLRCKPLPSIGNSDHDIVLYDTFLAAVRQKPIRRKIYLWKSAKMETIKTDIKTFDAKDKSSMAGVEAKWAAFKDMLLNSIEKNVPSKFTQGRHSLPWMTGKIKRAIKRKQKAHTKSRMTKKKRDRDRYKRLQTEVRKMIRDSNKEYLTDVVSQNKQGNPKKCWSYVKSKRQENSGVPPLKDAEGYVRSDRYAKADILNTQFHSAYTKEDVSNIPDMGAPACPSMKKIRVDNKGVYNLLCKLDPYKASGPDGIPPKILKEAAYEISPILTEIYQESIDTGTVPLDWREAVMIPAFKKGERHDPANYRPISLTSVCSKILEHIIHSSIMSHFDKNRVLCDNQHGFRKRRSCETQLIVTIDNIARQFANNVQVDIILLDFSKAFDKVPHYRLLAKLKHYGVSGSTAAWIEAFLKDRTQRVYVDGAESGKLDVMSGVPQGTVLGPLLFLAYINDLPNSTPNSHTRLFADDSLLFRTITSRSDAQLLQKDLSNLENWEQKWQMDFNPGKCTVLRIAPPRHTLLDTSYNLHGETLSTSTCTKYLGVTFSNDLTWDHHINSITGKANRSLGFLRRNFKDCTTSVKRETYTTIVRPTLEYAATIWDPNSVKHIDKIEMVQRRAARFVNNNYWDRTPGCVTNMINKLGWESLEERRKNIRLSMLYRIDNDQVDIDKYVYLQANDRRTRRQGRFFQERITSPILQNSFFPRTIRDWNSLPADTEKAGTLDLFRQRLKRGGQGGIA